LAALSLRVRFEAALPLPNLRVRLERWLAETYGGAPRLVALIPSGSSGNLCWWAEHEQGALFLKLRSGGPVRSWEAGRDVQGAFREAEGEARILEALADLPGFPRLLRTLSGERVASFAAHEGAPFVSPVLCETLISLHPLAWSDAVAFEVGARLAQVHERLRALPLAAESSLPSKLERLRAPCVEPEGALPSEVRQVAAEVAREGLRQLATCVHGDLGPGNLGGSDTGEVVLVDFSDFKRDPPASELGRVLLWMAVLSGAAEGTRAVRAGARRLAEGYARGGSSAPTPDEVVRFAVLHYAFDLDVSLAGGPTGADREHVLGPFLRARPTLEALARHERARRGAGAR
jgi:hypothetical protein